MIIERTRAIGSPDKRERLAQDDGREGNIKFEKWKFHCSIYVRKGPAHLVNHFEATTPNWGRAEFFSEMLQIDIWNKTSHKSGWY
jgi:hypothetical protein